MLPPGTYIVAGGGQDFVRVYSSKTYGIPPEQVVGTAGGTSFGYDKNGRPFLTKEPQLLLNHDPGKPGDDVIRTAFGPNLPPLGAIKTQLRSHELLSCESQPQVGLARHCDVVWGVFSFAS
jgi:hypothetical protein